MNSRNAPKEFYFVHIEIPDMDNLPRQEERKSRYRAKKSLEKDSEPEPDISQRKSDKMINLYLWSSSSNKIQTLSLLFMYLLATLLELLHFKNRQKKTSNLVFLKNQALTKLIQIFPPKISNRKK